MRRSFTCLSKEVLVPLYTSVVRHYLEYGGILWTAIANRTQIRAIEKVQRRAVSMVHDLQDIEYSKQIKALNLTTLSARRARGLMIEMWKHFYIYDKDTVRKPFGPGFSGRRNFGCH